MKKERKTRKEKVFAKTFGWLLCSIILIGFIEQVSALTFTIYATREGLVGETTANGHIIEPNDHFVALPSGKALCSLDGHEYEVRITYQGNSIVAPVWDVGPWNIQDDYWNPSSEREMWQDLPQGMPEAQSAYQNNYNGGKDQFGRTVTNPAGIDLAGDDPPNYNGLFWDLGLTDNDWVTVEFLWISKFYVPDDYLTIQAAIDDCNNGDTIIVRDGTYTDDGNRDIDFQGKTITLRSENGPDNCIIDCQGTEAEPRRGFYFHSGEYANSVIDGFTITNGYAYSGGGISCGESSGPTIANCIISNNSADYSGGGICCSYESSPTITNCTINDNLGGLVGGGISCSDSSPIITDCTIGHNTTGEFGTGGGIECWNSSPEIINNTIISNVARHGGGGIYCCYSSPYIANNLISGNIADEWGGGIYCVYSSPDIINNTISGNKTTGEYGAGGGVASRDSSPEIRNCVLWADTANYGNEIMIYCYEPEPSTLIVTYSNVQGGQTGVYIEIENGYTPLVWGDGNIDIDSLFACSGYWDPNNTPADANDDFWVDGDYHLKSQAGRWDSNSETWVKDDATSVCVDAADPNSNWTSELWPHGKRVNMGAYGGIPQASISLSILGNIANLNNDPDDEVDLFDLSLFTDKWCYEKNLLSEDLNRNGLVNLLDFAIFAAHWLWPESGTMEGQGDGMSASSSQQLEQPLDIQPVQQVQPVEVQPVKEINIDELVNWLEEIWLQDDGIAEMISEDEWNKFIDSVENP